MRANEFAPWRANDKIPVVDFSTSLDFDPDAQSTVMLQYETEQHPNIPEMRTTEMHACIIDLGILRAIRAHMGRIWALKYVRACTVTPDAPYGCSLLVAKHVSDAFCPNEKYVADDNRREQERRVPQLLEETERLQRQLSDELRNRWELVDELHAYRTRFGSLHDIALRDPDPRD